MLDLSPHESSFGSSRKAFAATTSSRRVFVRCAVPGLGLEATLFNLAREALVLRGLADAGLRVPRPLIVSPDGAVVVLEWLDGDVGPCGDPDERERLARKYVDLIVGVADIDPSTVLASEWSGASTVADALDLELSRWPSIAPPSYFDDVVASSLLDWLDETAPRDPSPSTLVHGDAGHGNFLVDGQDVCGLIDWELSHCGDPLEDIACMQMRSVGRDAPIWRAAIESSHRDRGTQPDGERLAWERVHVLVRSAIAMHRSLERGNEGRAEAPFARFKNENLLLSLREVERLSRRGWTSIPDLPALVAEGERRCAQAGPASARVLGAEVAFGYPED